MAVADNVEYIIHLKDQFSKEINKINKSLSGFDKKIAESNKQTESMGSKLLSVGTIAKAGFLALATGAVMATKSMIGMAMSLEQTEIALEVMTGSAEKTQALIKEVKEYAKATPFGTSDLLDNAKMMMQNNIASEKVMKSLKMLGDVSGGSAEKMKYLTYAFSQTASAGKLTGQDLLQYINAGFNPLQEIALKTGKSIGDLKDLMSKGGISVEMVEDAFKSATSEGGRFYGMLDKQSKTAGGQWDRLKETVAETATNIGTKFLPFITTGLNEVIPYVEKLGTKFIDFAQKVIDNWYKIEDAFSGLWESIESVGSSMDDLMVTMGIFSRQGDDVENNMSNIAKAIKPLVSILKGVLKLNQLVVIGVDDTIEIFKKWYKEGGVFKKMIDIYFIEPIESLMIAIDMLGSWMDDLNFDRAKEEEAWAKKKADWQKKYDERIAKNKEDQLNKDIEAVKELIDGKGENPKKGTEKSGYSFMSLGLDEKSNKEKKASKEKSENTITGAAPKVFNININQVVGEITNNINNIKEGTSDLQKQITNAILKGVADVQIIS